MSDDFLYKYLNIPFTWYGADFTGVDCVGLVRLFYWQEFNIQLPPFPEYSDTDHKRPALVVDHYQEHGFTKASQPRFGDIVSFRVYGIEQHFAIVLNSSQALQADTHGVNTLNYISDPAWVKRRVSFYTHRDRKDSTCS